MIVLVMGVSGVGKTTIGEALAQALGWRFVDADDYHPAANVMDDAELKRFLDDNRKNVTNTVRQMPQHMDYLRKYSPAPPPVR